MDLAHIIDEVVPAKTIGGGFSVMHSSFAISLRRNRLDWAAKQIVQHINQNRTIVDGDLSLSYKY